ncbi:hypothetical protein AAF712_016198 [Marasmius tenuissimus]|uniref:Glycoside hydrolase family 76 protein n=1 Tax=Marasmius tenuissimus TaxID=585030 RepID=A0ABR2Z7G0_9AGAR
MAKLDLITSQAKYKTIVQDFYLKALQDLEIDREYEFHFSVLHSSIDNCHCRTRSQLVYGYAALLAYHAYSDESFLRVAEKHWNLGLSFTLTDSDITAGVSRSKNISIASRCPNGATLVGGTFSVTNNESNAALNAGATGDFLILSATLSSATSNQTYLELAQKSADFIHHHMYSGNGVFYNQLNATDCSPVNKLSRYPYDSGSIIHGLSLLSSLTQNMSTVDFVQEIVVKTTSNPAWHRNESDMILNLEGVKYSDGGEPKARLMRGYTELYQASTTPTDLKSYLESYISTQFNAVVDLAKSGGSNVYGPQVIYGPQYNGPPRGTQFVNDSQAGAITALMGGLAVGENNASGSEPLSRSVPVGAIVGGVIGGITLAGLVAASLWVYRLRVRAQRDHETVSPWEAPAPFFDTMARSTGKNPPPPPKTSTVLGPSDASPDSGATSTLESMATTTEGLLSALNQRVENERRWDPNEPPPEYSSQIERGGVERGKRTTG